MQGTVDWYRNWNTNHCSDHRALNAGTVPSDTTKQKNKQPTGDTERHTVTRMICGHSEKAFTFEWQSELSPSAPGYHMYSTFHVVAVAMLFIKCEL